VLLDALIASDHDRVAAGSCNRRDRVGVPGDMTERTDHRDQTALLVFHAAAWSADNEVHPEETAAPSVHMAERPLTTDERAVALRSARYASLAFPGPVGDLVSSRIQEYVLDGRVLEPFSLPHRLVRSLQTMEDRNPLPPAAGYDHLPARYVPGSAMRWRYRTTADEGAKDRD
jgi:hypothetical protein